jgi:hypothetical protein
MSEDNNIIDAAKAELQRCAGYRLSFDKMDLAIRVTAAKVECEQALAAVGQPNWTYRLLGAWGKLRDVNAELANNGRAPARG